MKQYGHLINEEREARTRFEAALAGKDLGPATAATSGNEAWRQAMRAKHEMRMR